MILRSLVNSLLTYYMVMRTLFFLHNLLSKYLFKQYPSVLGESQFGKTNHDMNSHVYPLITKSVAPIFRRLQT